MARLGVKKTYKLFIGGKFPRTESGRYYPLVDGEGNLLANVSLASRKDFRNAVLAARKAQAGWQGATADLKSADHPEVRRFLDAKSGRSGDLAA